MATIPVPRLSPASLRDLYRPIAARSLAAASAALVLATAIYCMLYNWAQGTQESVPEAVGWAVANLLPWLLAFEFGKRFIDDPERAPAVLVARFALVIAAAFAVSLALETLFAGGSQDSIELASVRRLPAALLVTGLLLLRRPIEWGLPEGREDSGEAARADSAIPFLAGQILWVKAAGNYLEFRADGRTSLCRMTMKQAEEMLGRQGFLRVHRSALVNTSRIAQIRPGKLYDEIELKDGTWVRVGGAYRSAVREYRDRRL